ncbi:poly(A)-specific ribonuclease PNLDC1 isoform X1 [Bos taurus]|uniref:poly(A)-specific ribonuclease PNLDC1 isoform X1 n=2 Tax=Bos taurus TaxID=9913 RepID=UPI0007603C25|nr:poly(A)-specific ribonuclease PNLDC1 isoform X1 [Bos taurus]
MDIGADEFEQSLPLLQELVLGADFVGLDIEFTGLRSNLSGPQQISLFDLPSEWYLKTRQSVQQFTICQIGLSVFSSIEGESNKYVAHSCNFFLFPTTFGVLDSEFSFQASSVQFLNQYGFDYNKFLKNGIPYMNEEQEKKIKHNILTGNWKVRSSLDKDQIKVVIDEVTRWLDLAEEGDWMTLPGIAGFQAFEVQLVLRKALPDIWTVLRDQGVIVKKVSTQHRWYLETTSCDRESCWKEKILLSARGFSVFFQMLVKARKPLVGHNMMMDLLHLHEKFFRPLPESYDEFKLNIHNLFPVLIDTKNVTKDIWKELNFPRVSNLSEVYEVLNSDLNPTKNSGPVIIHASRCEKYVETKYPHEAAYDAFLCGSVLLKVAHLLLWKVHSAVPIPEPSFPLYLDVLAPYVNQVNLIRAGVPKIVSRLHSALCRGGGQARARMQHAPLGSLGLLTGARLRVEKGAHTEPVIFFLVLPCQKQGDLACSFFLSHHHHPWQTGPFLVSLSGCSSWVGGQSVGAVGNLFSSLPSRTSWVGGPSIGAVGNRFCFPSLSSRTLRAQTPLASAPPSSSSPSGSGLGSASSRSTASFRTSANLTSGGSRGASSCS